MKNLIVTISIVIILSLSLIYQGDMNLYSRNCKRLEEISKDTAVSVFVIFDENYYGDGYIVYPDDIAYRAKALIDRQFNFKYWKGGYNLKIECVSENEPDICRCYTISETGNLNSIKLNSNSFSGQWEYNTPRTRLTITAKKPNFSLKWLKEVNTQVTKTGIAKYEGH